MKALVKLGLNEGINITKLSRKVDVTYSHTINIVMELENRNIIFIKQKNKRERNIFLTQKGQKLFDSLSKFYSLMEVKLES